MKPGFISLFIKKDNKRRKRFGRDKNVFKCARLKAQTIDHNGARGHSEGKGEETYRPRRCVAMRHATEGEIDGEGGKDG